MAEGRRAPEVKVVLLGETGTGKSSLVLRFVTGKFKAYSESTIGASFMAKTLELHGEVVRFQLWDTAGQEKYHSLAPMYYRNALAAVVVYDVTSAPSFARLQRWIQELQHQGPPGLALTIAGNKSDLAHGRAVDFAEAKHFAEAMGATYFETSAKTGHNVDEMFHDLCRRVEPPAEAEDFGLAPLPAHTAQGCCY